MQFTRNRRQTLKTAVLSASSLCLQSKLFSGKAYGLDAATVANQWPEWRGPQRNGYFGGTLPVDLDTLSKSWSVDFSDSYSGPIVGSGLVYTTETVNEQYETVHALDVKSGREIWSRQWEGAMTVPFFAKANGSWIRSTPALHDGKLVVCGMRDHILCLDAATGETQWDVDFISDHGAQLPAFGLVCSPAVDSGFVYVQAGGAVRKIRLSDGQLLWQALADQGGTSGGAFSSPVIDEILGVKQLVVQTRESLAGVDLDTGDVLWQQPIQSFRGMNILTPTVWGNRVFTSSYGGKSQLYEISHTAGSWAVKQLWEGRSEAYMSSPILVGDFLYIHLKNNRIACVDLNSGQETWRTTPFGKYWSMVCDGQNILALDERGELILFEATPEEFRVLDRRQVCDQQAWAHLAIIDNQLFIRRQKGLDAWSWA